MRFSDALPLGSREVVSFIGAGGKTAAMFRLADDLAVQGWRVISTATMSMTQQDVQRIPHRFGLGPGMRLPPSLPANLDRYRHVFVFTRIDRNSQVRGVRPLWLDDNLATFDYHDILLVEADTADARSFKAPKPDEPNLPLSTSVVVLVVGVDALQQSLSDENVYGARSIRQWLGQPDDSPIKPSDLAAALLHPALGMKNILPHIRVAVLLNKVTEKTLPQARQVARTLLTDYRVERVLVGAVQTTDPILEVQRRLGGVILAAGDSSRMGHPKFLLPWAGTTIIQHIAKQAAAAHLLDVVVVGNNEVDTLIDRLEKFPVRVINSVQGEMFLSVKHGLDALRHTCDAAFIMLGDQPMVPQEVLTALSQAYAEGKGGILIPSYDNRRGHPILIDRAFWPALFDLPDDASLRDFLAEQEQHIRHVVVNTDAILFDIDTPEDYERARRAYE